MSAVRCVVFDVDDTLYLEREYVRSGFVAAGEWAAAALRIHGFGERCWAEFEAGARGDVFDRVLSSVRHVATRDVIDELVRCYRAHVPKIGLLDDARACLQKLAARVRLAAITDGPLESQRKKVDALGLGTWLQPIVYTAQLGPGFAKPSEEPFRRVERLVGASGAACAYVGDNPSKDFRAPAALGWRTIRVRRSGGLHSAAPSGPDVHCEIADVSALPSILGIDT